MRIGMQSCKSALLTGSQSCSQPSLDEVAHRQSQRGRWHQGWRSLVSQVDSEAFDQDRGTDICKCRAPSPLPSRPKSFNRDEGRRLNQGAKVVPFPRGELAPLGPREYHPPPPPQEYHTPWEYHHPPSPHLQISAPP